MRVGMSSWPWHWSPGPGECLAHKQGKQEYETIQASRVIPAMTDAPVLRGEGNSRRVPGPLPRCSAGRSSVVPMVTAGQHMRPLGLCPSASLPHPAGAPPCALLPEPPTLQPLAQGSDFGRIQTKMATPLPR